MTDQDEIERLMVAVHQVIQKARELELPLGLLGEILIDQGTKILLEAKGRDAAAVWLAATLDDLRSKGFETTGPVGRA